jgi:ABC-2 type transport system permease protein
MDKYLRVAQNTWQENIEYRLNFLMWRIRVMLQLITVYVLWYALLPAGDEVFGYTQSMMLTYVLGTAIVGSFVFSSRSYSIADEVNSGELSNFLIRPIHYFTYHFARDIGDKGLNIICSFIEFIILVLLLRPQLYVQTSPEILVFTVLAIVLAVFLYFFCNVLLGMIGFWSPEVWAPRFIFMTLLTFFSGGLFPLDILPHKMFEVFQILPFGYMLYFPLKVYLGQIPIGDIWVGLGVSFAWTIILFVISKMLWRIGLKNYTAQGR